MSDTKSGGWAAGLLDRIARLPAAQWTAVVATGNLVAVAVAGWFLSRATDWRFQYLLILAPLAFVYYFVWYKVSQLRTTMFPYHPDLVIRMVRELSEWRRYAQAKIAAPKVKPDDLMDELRSLLRRIREAVESGNRVRGFGSPSNPGLEVCLMAETLHANLARPDGSRPLSCVTCAVRDPITKLRFSTEPEVYNNTEAAKLYAALKRGEEPAARVLSDTHDERHEFDHLDSGPAAIGSMVISPLRRHALVNGRSIIAGCLVIFAHERGYFDERHTAFWSDFADLVGPDLVFILERIEAASRSQLASQPTAQKAPW